jgi:hypothetical protein
MEKATISVYLKSGQVFEYDITSDTQENLSSKAREHMYAIFQGGYRSGIERGICWYGPHWIDKIKVSGILTFSNYPDTARGT